MKLNYRHMPEVGTVVYHKPDAPNVMDRFYAIGIDGHTLRLADAREEVYVLAQPHAFAPRSVIEHYILRRVWTPYGYAKVWGHTPLCTPLEHPAYSNLAREIIEQNYGPSPASKAALARDRCVAWWEERHPSPEPRPEGRDYMKMINKLYHQMAEEIDGGN